MSCLPWGYANKVVPVFVPAAGESLIVQGNALVNGGFLNIGNNNFEGNVSGAFLRMTPDNPLTPSVRIPYYIFQATPDSLFKLSRENTPSPAIASNSQILQISPVITPGNITNTMVVNAQTTVQAAVISSSIVSGFSGMKYLLGLTNGPSTAVPDFFYRGGTLLIKSYEGGDGFGFVILPSDIFTNTIYVGATIFKFIFPANTTIQTLVLYKSDNTPYIEYSAPRQSISEAIWTGDDIQTFSYPCVEANLGGSAPTVSSTPRRNLVGVQPVEDLPLAKLSQPIV